MKPSPLQLKEVNFIKFSVEAETAQDNGPVRAIDFNFNGVTFKEGFEIENKSDESKRRYVLFLQFSIENETGTRCPYKLDAHVIGLFEVAKSYAPADPNGIEDLVRVNGASMLYGMIRDEVLALTSRSVHGTLVLPTVNFLDYKIKPGESPAEPKLAKAPARKKQPRKSIKQKPPEAIAPNQD